MSSSAVAKAGASSAARSASKSASREARAEAERRMDGGAPAAPTSSKKPKRGDLQGTATLEIHAKKLKKMDTFSQSDGFFEVEFDQRIVYKSEVIKSNADPKWKAFDIDVEKLCKGNASNSVRILVYDDDDAKKTGTNENKRDFIGHVIVKLDDLVGKEIPLDNPAKPKEAGKLGTLVFKKVKLPKGKEKEKDRDSSRSKSKDLASTSSAKDKPPKETGVKLDRSVYGSAAFKLSAKDLKKMDKLAQSDGFVEVHHAGRLVHRTEVKKSNKDPKWREFKLDVGALCGNDATSGIVFKVFDDDSAKKDGKDEKKRDFIGEVTIPLSKLAAQKGIVFDLADPKKPKDKRGKLIFDSVVVTVAEKPRERAREASPPRQRRRDGDFPVTPPRFMDEPHLHIDLDYDSWDTLRASTEYQLQLALRRHQEAVKQVELAVEVADRADVLMEDLLDEMDYRKKLRRRDWDQNGRRGSYSSDEDSYGARGRSRGRSSRRGGASEWTVSADRSTAARKVRDAATVREAIVAGTGDDREEFFQSALSPRSRAGWKRTVSPLRRERQRDLRSGGYYGSGW